MDVFRGLLESACLPVSVSVCPSVCVQNTTFCQRADRGIKLHSVTALVLGTLFCHLQMLSNWTSPKFLSFGKELTTLKKKKNFRKQFLLFP